MDPKIIAVLDVRAGELAALFLRNTGTENRDWVMREFFNFRYKNEFDYLVTAVRGHLGPVPRADFNARVAKLPARSA